MASPKKTRSAARNTASRKKPVNSPKKRGSPKRSPAGSGGLAGGEWTKKLASRGVIGVVLLVVGLFLTVSFVTGGGAVLGDWGRAGVTRLLGIPGLALPPLVAVAGILLLLDRFPRRRAVGVGLLLLAAAATFAAAAPEGTSTSAGVYPDYGGILGGMLYTAVSLVGGVVGAVLVIGALYAVGASLLTGITLDKALQSTRSGTTALFSRGTRLFKGGADQHHRKRPEPRKEPGSGAARPQKVSSGSQEQRVREPLERDEVGSGELEVVLPDSRDLGDLTESLGPISGDYALPPASLLERGQANPEHDAEGTSRRLTRALSELGVEAQVVRAVVGPRVTRYELKLGSGVKVGKVRNLQQDIAYALAATEVRILAPIPGKSAVGVEVPNTRPAVVTLGDVFQEYPGANDWALPVGLGKDISGRAVFIDLAEMPHLLVAGTTGSGKSVMLNGLLTSLLLTTDPRQVKLVLVDPKRVELTQFGRIPHLITPVVTDAKKAANALSWAVAEMERRYEVLEKHGVRSLEGYNERSEKPMPYVVVVIDELADLMMMAAAKVEDAVIRLAQKARAVGIHLIVATQRPSVDVITGMIKANVPSRIAFAVSSQVDSRVILDTPGAEALLGSGDMLFKPVTALRPSRVQGAYISEREVERVVDACSTGAEARFIEEVTESRQGASENEEPEDDLLPEAATFVVASQQASVSAVQRRFRVGYSRAGRIIDALERKGVVGPYEGSKSRSVVATEAELGDILDRKKDAGGAGDSEDPDGSKGLF